MDFQLTPADVPSQKRSKRSPYEDILDQFLASGLDSARVDGTTYKPTTLASGLRKASDVGKMGVTVIQRGGEVFLIREDEDADASGEASVPETPRY
jgi:hypothetical protein